MMKPFARSMVWTGVLCVAMATSCKRPSEPEEEDFDLEPAVEPMKEQATEPPGPEPGTEAKQPGMAEAERPGAAEPTAVVIEQLVAPNITETEAKDLVEKGREVASAVDAAIAAIADNDVAEAKTEVGKAVKGLDTLAAERPSVDVAVALWREGRRLDVAETEREVDTIPLLATLTRVDVPVYDRKQVEARHAERREKQPGEVSRRDKAADLGIVDSSLVYLEVDMPIAATRIAVEDAQRLLDEGKADAAKAALQHAMGSFEVIQVVAEAPEYQARTKVWAAEKAFVRGDMVEAARLLGEAEQLLAPLAARAEDQPGQVMATMLLTEMKPLQEALIAGNLEQAEGFRRLERNALSFARRSALRSMMSRRQAAQQHALADALMWLEKAQTEGLSDQNAIATADLARAESVLVQAGNVAPATAQPNLVDLHNRIERIVELDRAATRDPDAIDEALREVIFDLRMLMLEIGTSPIPSEKTPSKKGPA